ncbi:MAG: hypothetical protein GC152_09205 [Alphaproteobacteria bacterium]|nr:hypothetical protein [Alphaproteobacteria bacterium]
MLLGAAVSVMASGFGAHAGEYARAADGGVYRFTGCVAPAAPVLSAEDERRLRRSARYQRQMIRAYNGLVDEVNAYFQCLRAEADADLSAYFTAVEGAFEQRQQEMLADIERLRAGVDASTVAPEDEAIEAELLGGAAASDARSGVETEALPTTSPPVTPPSRSGSSSSLPAEPPVPEPPVAEPPVAEASPMPAAMPVSEPAPELAPGPAPEPKPEPKPEPEQAPAPVRETVVGDDPPAAADLAPDADPPVDATVAPVDPPLPVPVEPEGTLDGSPATRPDEAAVVDPNVLILEEPPIGQL